MKSPPRTLNESLRVRCSRFSRNDYLLPRGLAVLERHHELRNCCGHPLQRTAGECKNARSFLNSYGLGITEHTRNSEEIERSHRIRRGFGSVIVLLHSDE